MAAAFSSGRGLDPLEDTERHFCVVYAWATTAVAGVSIRLRILKAASSNCGYSSSTVSGRGLDPLEDTESCF
jgi:hypothetical protein